MGEIAPFLVPITMFLTVGAVIILRGPLGKAIGERIAGRSKEVEGAPDVEALRGEMEDLRWRVTELEERLDFAERVLARHQEPERLSDGN